MIYHIYYSLLCKVYCILHIISIHHFPSKSEKCLELSKFLHICSSQCRGFFPAEAMVRSTTSRSNQAVTPGNNNLIIIYDDTNNWSISIRLASFDSFSPNPNWWMFGYSFTISSFHPGLGTSLTTTLIQTHTPLSMPHRRTALGCVELLRQPTRLSEPALEKKCKPLLNTRSLFTAIASF